MPIIRWVIATTALAWVIAGETGSACSLEAKMAIARVADNRIAQGIGVDWVPSAVAGSFRAPVGYSEGDARLLGWYGWGRPRPVDMQLAIVWSVWGDDLDGAIYAIAPENKPLLWWLEGEPVRSWSCGVDVY